MLTRSARSALLTSRNESFSFNAVPGSSTFTATVYGLFHVQLILHSIADLLEHHTLGKDVELGEAEVDVRVWIDTLCCYYADDSDHTIPSTAKSADSRGSSRAHQRKWNLDTSLGLDTRK